MTPTGPRPSFRASRLVGGTLGVVAGAALLAFLVVVGVILWVVNVTLPERQRESTEAEQASARKAAAAASGALAAAAADGRLTDDEIGKAVGGPVWDVRRAETTWLVRARFDGTEPICFAYDITLPLGPQTRVTGTELPACPAITPGG